MKKSIAAAMSMAMTFCMATSAFAATSVSVNDATYTYISGQIGNKDITDELKEIRKVANGQADKATQTIKIDSRNFQTNEMEFKLVVSDSNEEDEISAVDYFVINSIKNPSGTVIYSEDEASLDGSKEIVLGRIDKKTEYTVEVSKNSTMDAKALGIDDQSVVWQLEYTDNEEFFAPTEAPVILGEAGSTSTSVPVAVSTPAPVVIPNPTEAVTVESASPDPSATASAEPTKTPEKIINILCTSKKQEDSSIKTVAPGNYKLVGNGHVIVADKDGNIKLQIDMDSEKDEDGNGIANKTSIITTLAEGDTINIEGDSKAFLQFKSPDSTTTSTTGKNTAKATQKPSTTASTTTKKNPTTGDSAPIAVAAVLALGALSAAAYVGISSRKKKQ